MRRLLAAVFVISALFAASNVYAGEMSITKCTVTAGKTEGYDTIVVSGEMDATTDDLSANSIEVTVDSDDMVSPCVQSFPIDETTLKNGKYKYSKTENSSKISFTFDTKTSKFSFTAKNVDLWGLGCPLTIEIEIGDYTGAAEVNEAIVNGSKKPIPIKLMMGVKNALRVDSYKVKHGKKPNTDQLTAKGGFAVEDPNVNLVEEEIFVTLGEQTFTLPAGSFKANKKKDKFTCSKADVTEGGIASATFNFITCSFTLTIKNTTITATGTVNLYVVQANSMLAGATSYDGAFPPLSSIVYPTKSGDTLTLTVAYAGFVDVHVNPTTDVVTVSETIEANGGTVVAEVPAAGLYLVQVPIGQEAVFLTAMYAYTWVEDGSPASPVAQGAIRVLDWDLNGTDLCGALHMTGVSTVASRLGRSVSETDVWMERKNSILLAQTLLRRMEMDEICGRRTVYNLSLQSAASGDMVSNLDRTGCTTVNCRTIRHQQILFYHAFLSGMEEMAQKNPDVLNNAVVTIIAGNAGMDLDNELAALKYRFPNAFKRVVIVGGTDAAGNIDPTLSHLADNSVPNMVYTRGRGVHVGTSLCDGTSFAAPEISAVLDYIWSRNPALTSDQVVNAFKQALAELGANNVVPQDNNGFTTQTFLDRAVVLAVGGGPPPTCTYTYSDWSACQQDNTQTRTVISSSPPGCVGTPVLSQSCTYVPPPPTGDFTGTWLGTYSLTNTTPCTNYPTVTHNGNTTLTIVQNGSSFTGSGIFSGIKDLAWDGGWEGNCYVANLLTFTGTTTGTISGTNVTGTVNFGNPDLFVNIVNFTGTLTGSTISGTLSGDGTGTFSVTKQ